MTYNITMKELPITCNFCNTENMINMSELSSRQIDKVATSMGFACGNCDKWVHVYYTTLSLDKAMEKLAQKSPSNINYHFHFYKTLKKAEGIQEKYGTF